ncbi:MAG TPA: aminotransferase class I/II-fold pyridoxal phosphate-dependent enzyme [Acidimicrobiales bacterium]|nr:aminotransferase class I/II-fold pyridoxal phosphate-dependent enzyme [Acidimicrobiales bacterium]
MSAHGGDVVSAGRALGVDPATILDLSASLNPLAPDVTALAPTLLGHLRRYVDDVEVAEATSRLARVVGVEADRLVLTNGAAEAIALVAAAQPRGWVEPPEFSLYERHLAVLQPDAPRWRSNPNNPVGHLAAPEERAGVWDESFFPLAAGTWTRGDDDAYRIGSLTKLWACPGLRLGYVIAPSPAAALALAARQPAWSVNGLALALLAPLLDRTDLAAWAAGIAVLRREVARLFARFDVVESAANWVLVHGAGHLRTPLARQGVLVRDCASFGLAGTIRVAVPAEAGLERLATALVAVQLTAGS